MQLRPGIPATHRATKTVRIEMIYRSFKHYSQKHANGFVPLPYQPENNDCSGGHPACRRAVASSPEDTTLAQPNTSEISCEPLMIRALFPGGRDARRYERLAHPYREPHLPRHGPFEIPVCPRL
jgi:hypothetical protein